MNPARRAWLQAAALLAGLPARLHAQASVPDTVQRGRALQFPRDHGAHPGAALEWWYLTGWLQDGAALLGWQLTFFRSRIETPTTPGGRFAPRQLLFAHAALSDIAAGRYRHAQRIARWSGDEAAQAAHARRDDTALRIGQWQLQRDASGTYQAQMDDSGAGFGLAMQIQPTQAVLLQGDAGFSRKGPQESQASHYYSQPQLMVQARVTREGRTLSLNGTGWLDHEWSQRFVPPDAVGWDWLGINLADGGALTAFRLRSAQGHAVWAGGSLRRAGGSVQDFEPMQVQFTPLRHWRSPATGASYPVAWRITTPAGSFELHALMDAQELDSRASSGAVYWEGLSELRQGGAVVGRGYLEMTGYVSPLRLG